MAGSESLYEMLGVEKTASQAEIKKAYYRLALQWHPDRNSGADAKEKFQALQRVYDVLSDPEKRKVYDRTGSLQDCEEMMQSDNFQELYNAFRAAVKVTEEDVDTFAVQYRGSAEERADLLRHYVEFKGDMEHVFDWLMLSRPDMDSHRFRDTLEQAITAGEVKSTKKYKAWSQKVAVTPKPTADPLAPPPKRKSNGKQKADDSMALVAAIKSKEKAFSGMLASLEAKYSKSDSSKGKGSVKASKSSKKAAAAERSDTEERSGDENAAEPTEEEFQAARARIEQRQQQAAGKGRQGQQRKKQEAGSSKKAKKQRKA